MHVAQEIIEFVKQSTRIRNVFKNFTCVPALHI